MSPTLDEIASLFSSAGALKVLAKPLSENDNSKQQIYLGGSFEVLKEIPAEEVIAHDGGKRPNFKAKINLLWMGPDGRFIEAPHAQLILYPDYPEVRLSGFLRGCNVAPSSNMQPIPKELRGPKNQRDGRILFLAPTAKGTVLAFLANPGSFAALEFEDLRVRGHAQLLANSEVIYQVPTSRITERGESTEVDLLTALARINSLGWADSIRLNRHGQAVPYNAPNAGGYTLEALLDIIPNGRAEPDFKGWEVKGYGGDRITLMTPEPDLGVYGVDGAERFLAKYGYLRDDGAVYFTGTHRANTVHPRTKQTLFLSGFDPGSAKITNVSGGLQLVDQHGALSAGWSFARLIKHWADKHSQAAYVKYESRRVGDNRQYRYLSPIHLGVGTDFSNCLQQMHEGGVVYDPATKLEPPKGSGGPRIKSRNQFRIGRKNLAFLYEQFYERDL